MSLTAAGEAANTLTSPRRTAPDCASEAGFAPPTFPASLPPPPPLSPLPPTTLPPPTPRSIGDETVYDDGDDDDLNEFLGKDLCNFLELTAPLKSPSPPVLPAPSVMLERLLLCLLLLRLLLLLLLLLLFLVLLPLTSDDADAAR